MTSVRARGPAAEVAALFAPPADVAADPAVRAAQRLADDLLAPGAAAADDPARGVTRERLDALTAAGLQSTTVTGTPPRADAEAVEILAGACGATWFVSTQHRSPQRLARGAPVGLDPAAVELGLAAGAHREALATAAEQAGIAITHLRRPGPPPLRAEPDGSGWRFAGTVDWCTGWGLIDVVMIAAEAPDGRVVFGLLPARDGGGLQAGDPLPLAVMGGTRTVAATLDQVAVPRDAVLTIVDGAAWRAYDAAVAANTTPASLGLLRRILGALAELGEARGRPEATEAALALAPRAAALRSEAYALVADVPLRERTRERIAVRAEVTALLGRAADALVAARSGSALFTTSPEQRWAREAAFHLVQAQTAEVRVAQLAALTS